MTRKLVRNNSGAAGVYEYNAGEYFAKANVKGAHKFIEEEKKKFDPSYIMRSWNKISNNALISSIISVIFGFFMGMFFS